jgi:aminobenzoyl-glutamate utilization protein A
MPEKITEITRAIQDTIIADRRDFHQHAETGWCEFRTASLVARRLLDLGYEGHAGREVLRDEDRMGLPAPEMLEQRWQRALAQGGDAEYLAAVRGGFTGVVGILRGGDGPTVALRFDMDALDLGESQNPDHRPAREGFASVNPEAMHACGHDAHTAIGLGVAEVLMRLRGELRGTVKLVFQPAEEGVRGAKGMVGAGVMDDVDYLLSHHLYSGWELGELDPGRGGFLATTKFDAFLIGAPAHAGGRPNAGKNALLAAATAVLNLHAIPRHKEGATRINVGRLVAGSGRNVVPAEAHLVVETRGASTKLNDYVYECAQRILESAATMHGCTLQIRPMGAAQSASSDPELAERISEIAHTVGEFTPRAPEGSGGSEDVTYMMARVQEQGGQAVNIGLGAGSGAGGHHTANFDIDERALPLAVKLLSAATVDLIGG